MRAGEPIPLQVVRRTQTPAMRVFVTGATGVVGRALAMRLRRSGHEVTAWVRDEAAARQVLGAEARLVSVDVSDQALARALSRCDAVVNLAGAPISKRWTAAHRRRLVRSRVGVTQRIVAACGLADAPPKAFVSASAVGAYGDRGDERLDESARLGDGFLAQLCRDWEAAADAAAAHGARVVKLRFGIVLSEQGGALGKLVPATRWGGGVAVGSGDQFMPWIHLDDLVSLIERAVTDAAWSGVYNACAPEPVTNAAFTRALARALHRPAWARVPTPLLRVAMGAMSQVLTDSQRAVPARASAAGFAFAYPELDAALHDILHPAADGAISIERVTDVPSSVAYFDGRRPRYRLRQTVVVDAPRGEVFDLFREAENLGALTPDDLSFEIRTPTPIDMHEGTHIDYRIRLGPVPMTWKTRIEIWEPEARFVDAQYRGPYAAWYHEHRFEQMPDGRTKMTDIVWYAPPLGIVGAIANRLFISAKLHWIFGYRTRVIRRRFGLASPSGAPADAPARRRSA